MYTPTFRLAALNKHLVLRIFCLVIFTLRMFVDNEEEQFFSETLSTSDFRENWEKLEGTTFCLQNIRSGTKNFDNFLGYLESFTRKIDIITLTETWGNLGNIDPPGGYQIFNSKGMSNKCSGSSILTKNSLKAKEFNIVVNEIPELVDTCFITINNLDVKPVQLVVGAVYRSPSSSLGDFLGYWESILKFFDDINYNVWISGDFNIDISKNSGLVNRFVSICSNFGFRILRHGPTRCGQGGSSTIDICVTNINKSTTVFSTASNITDHCSVFACVELALRVGPGPANTTKPPKTDFRAVIEELKNCEFDDVLQQRDINQAVDSLVRMIQLVIKKYTFPVTHSNKYDSPRKPWMSKGILNALRRKRKLYDKYRKYPKDSSIKLKYQTYSNKLGIIIKEAKQRHFKGLLDLAKGDSRRTWKIINEIREGKSANSLEGPDSLVKEDGSEITNPVEMANMAIETILKVGKDTPVQAQNTDRVISNQSSAFLFPVTLQELVGIINSLKSKASVGVDGIPIGIFKSLPNFHVVLVYLCNRMLELGIFPDSLKTGLMKFKFKGGSKHQIQNFRPITILNSISKIFEKVILSRIISFVNKFSLIHSSQFGFSKGLNTDDAILSIITPIQRSLAEGKVALAMSMDVAKAFDTVPHKLLIAKLKKMGFRGMFSDLIASYLRRREVFAFIKGSLSTPSYLTRGLPQGSILGPTLFNLFINDLHTLEGVGNITSFADDNLSTFILDHPLEGKKVFEDWLQAQLIWYKNNGLQLNLGKCHFTIFGSKRKVAKLKNMGFCIQFDVQLFRIEDTIKYLGITLDSSLSWKAHVHQTLIETSFYIPLFYRLRHLLSPDTLYFILKATFLAKIQYGLIAFGNCSITTLQPLQVILNKLARIISFKGPRINVKTIMNNHGIVNLEMMYIVKLFKYSVKMQQGIRNTINMEFIADARALGKLRTGMLNLLMTKKPWNSFMRNDITYRIKIMVNILFKKYPLFIDEKSLLFQRDYLNITRWLTQQDVDDVWSSF